MKRNNIKQGFLSLAAACLAFTACTGDFERFNTDPNSAQEVDLKMFITTMQMDAVYSCSGSDTEPNNRYQAAYNLIGDVYAGYMSGTNNWNGGVNTQIYALNGTNWCNVPFSESFTNVMPAWLQLKYAHANGLLSDDIFAVANILKVMSLHRVSDIYGPLPVLHFGETENPYNSQEECYMHFFETLDSAIAVLKDVVENNPDAKPLEEVDALYHGDYSKWLKLANSVKLASGHAYLLREARPCEAVRHGSRPRRRDGDGRRQRAFPELGIHYGHQPARKDLERLQRHPHGRFDGLLSQRLQRPASSGLFPARYRR